MTHFDPAATGKDASQAFPDDATTNLFFRLADQLAGPVSPAKLRRALRNCLHDLGTRRLGLFTFDSQSAELACVAQADQQDEDLYFHEEWRTPPSAVLKFFTKDEALNRVACEESAALVGSDATDDLLLVSIPLHKDTRGLLLLDGAPDHPSQQLADIGELLFAAADHCIRDANRRSLSADLAEVLNFSDSVYASWHESSGWHYHNVNGMIQLGYRKEDLSLRSLEAHNPMHPDDWQEAYQLFQHTLREGVGYQHDYRAVGLNGEHRWYSAEVTVTETNRHNGARELVSISRDIDAMRAAAKAAVEKANLEKWLVAKAKKIFSYNDFASLNGVLEEVGSYLGLDRCTLRVVDPETSYCNLAAEWHRPKLRAIADMYPNIISQTGVGWIGRLVEHGDSYVVNEVSTDIPNAKMLAYHKAINVDALVTQPMIYEDKLTGYLALLSEQPRRWTDTECRVAKEIAAAIHMAILRNRLLDELRATDESFQLAMENSTYGLWDHDVAEGTLYYSPHFYEMLGYPREDDPIPIEQLLDYVHPDDHHWLQEEFRREYANRNDAVHLEMRHVKRDGSRIWILSRGKVIKRDDRGRPLRVLGVNVDITPQREVLAALHEARETAEAANRSKSEFLERMSHEIRTPMNAILGMSYLTLETELNDEQKMYLQDVDGAAKSLLHIIDDILDFSKIESGELTVISERFNLKEELQRISKLMSVRAAQAHNELTLDIANDVPEYAVGDKHRLGQILFNLLGNAIKFTSEGTVSLSVRCSDEDARTNSVALLFSVNDSGIGLGEAQIDTLFEPFVQAENSTTRKYGGTGLGLSICKHLVEMMGGSIRVSSSVGVGTTFDFTVVFKQQVVGRESLAPANPARGQHLLFRPQSCRQKRVLLAEDNLVNQRVAKGILAKLNIEVVTAANGEEALNILQQESFDAVLMDIEMPVLDGLAATRAIRRQDHFHDLPIVAMTAHAMTGDRERCLAAGMDDHIPKPVNPGNLRRILSRLWEENQWLHQDLGKQGP